MPTTSKKEVYPSLPHSLDLDPDFFEREYFAHHDLCLYYASKLLRIPCRFKVTLFDSPLEHLFTKATREFEIRFPVNRIDLSDSMVNYLTL